MEVKMKEIIENKISEIDFSKIGIYGSIALGMSMSVVVYFSIEKAMKHNYSFISVDAKILKFACSK
jgi:hypothetical protein